MIPLRLARELTYQLDRAHEHERLARALACVPVFLVLYRGEDESNVLTLWQQLSVKGHQPEKYYPASLESLRKRGSPQLPDALYSVNELFQSRGAHALAMQLLTELLAWAEEHKDWQRVMQAERGRGLNCSRRGDYEHASAYLGRSLEIAESLGDKRGMTFALNIMGIVHSDQGRYEEAMSCYERRFEMSESMGDKRGMAIVIGNMGIVHKEQGRHDEAMSCFERDLTISESLGDQMGILRAIGNMGTVLHRQGRYDEAMAYCKRCFEMCESLGDKRGMASGINNIGLIHSDLGRFDEAMSCQERKLEMSESIGDKRGRSLAIGNIGDVYLDRGEYEQALVQFRLALEESRAIGFLYGTTYWLLGIARALLKMGGSSRVEARANAEECMHLSKEISKPDTLFPSRVLLARIDAAEGNIALATEKLEAMLAEATGEEQIADLHYWLWKISSGDRDPGSRHAQEALQRYEALYSRIPKFEFRKRTAELRGERVPKSAEEIV